MKELERVLIDVITLSKYVGDFIRKESQNFDSSKIELKGLNDLVSYVDKEAEKMIVEGLKSIFPQAGFITEEGTAMEKGEVFNWIVDPLDGTTNFMHGLPVYAVSIALTENDKVILGVVHEVNRDECFYAIRGGKAYCNEKEISVSKASGLSQSLLATGFPYYDFGQMEKYLGILNEFMQKTHGLRRLGSAAVDLCYVACGRFEGYFEYNLNPWDVAAGSLIVQQAGGFVTDFKGGGDFVFGREIVAGNASQGQILEVIQRHWK
jgi:myo-inositol-1(or 4)-monophosphatase